MICFIPSEYPGGRILLRCGTVDVGAIFPGAIDWRWCLWMTGTVSSQNGKAKSEHAAKKAVMMAFRSFLEAAELKEANA